MTYKVEILTSSAADAQLINPIGLVIEDTNRDLWTVTNGTNFLKHYNKNGLAQVPTNIIVPVPAGPTGLVQNEGTGNGFVITSGLNSAGSTFIAATDTGSIYGFNKIVNATTMILGYTSLDGADYRGLAYNNNLIYATDFANGKIDTINFNWALQSAVSFPFTDPTLPAGYFPFGIHNVNNELYVTYALKTAGEPTPGAGLGVVSVFSYAGAFKRRLVTGGKLNAPWGVTSARRCDSSPRVLIGNNGDGTINEYNAITGKFLGTLKNRHHDPIVIPGLWTIDNENSHRALYFSAGQALSGQLGRIVKDKRGDKCRDKCRDRCKCDRRRDDSSCDSSSRSDSSDSSTTRYYKKRDEKKSCGCGK